MSFSQFADAATEMIAFGCMWSTNFAGIKLCSGVSIDEARGFRLKVAWLAIATISSSAADFRPLSARDR